MKFSETHEWVEIIDETASIGISQFAQKELGDIVFVELPKIGKKIAAGEVAVVLESTKAAADVYSPLSGTILSVNEKLKEVPELVNQSPEKEGWLFTIEYSNKTELDNLMDLEKYRNKFLSY